MFVGSLSQSFLHIEVLLALLCGWVNAIGEDWWVYVKKGGIVAFCTKLSLDLLPLWWNCGKRGIEWVKWNNEAVERQLPSDNWPSDHVAKAQGDKGRQVALNLLPAMNTTMSLTGYSEIYAFVDMAAVENENLEIMGFRVRKQQQKLSNAFSKHLLRICIFFCAPPYFPISLRKKMNATKP